MRTAGSVRDATCSTVVWYQTEGWLSDDVLLLLLLLRLMMLVRTSIRQMVDEVSNKLICILTLIFK